MSWRNCEVGAKHSIFRGAVIAMVGPGVALEYPCQVKMKGSNETLATYGLDIWR